MSNPVRIPAISAQLFPEALVTSLTEEYLSKHSYALYEAGICLDRLCQLYGFNHDDSDSVKLITDEFVQKFQMTEYLDLFGHNIALYFVETYHNFSRNVEEVREEMKKPIPLLRFAISESDELDLKIEDDTCRSGDVMYPLFNKPCDQTIRFFLDNYPEVAFCSVGGSHWFAYIIDSTGPVTIDHIAYAYLKVDGAIPDNVASKHTVFRNLNAPDREILYEYFYAA